MTSGTMKWFSADRGFGLISRDDGGADVFAHFSAVTGSGARGIEKDQRVEFDITRSHQEIQAVNIRPLPAVTPGLPVDAGPGGQERHGEAAGR